MSPPIEASILKVSPTRWLLGSTVICEIVESMPNDAFLDWKSEEGDRYCLRWKRYGDETHVKGKATEVEGLVHHAGTSAAVWSFGGIFFKVKAWRNGMQLESDTIRFINKISTIKTPRVLKSWIDTAWNRSFLILGKVEGKTLRQQWPSMSICRRQVVACQIARLCRDLASSTSERLESVDKKGVIEPFLRAPPPFSEPSWKPQFLGPYSFEDLQNHIELPALEKLLHGQTFCLQHVDLGPGNIMVSEEGNLTGVIDWEGTGYYPHFWLATKPLVSAGFYLDGVTKIEKQEWAHLLVDSLEREGFSTDMEAYNKWRSAVI